MKFPRLSHVYVKVFLGFWLVMITMLLGSSMVMHFFDLGPDKHLSSQEEASFHDPGGRLLREVVSDAINHNYAQVKMGISSMPDWAIKHVYMIDDQKEEILHREIPPVIVDFLRNINDDVPFFRKKIGQDVFYGRLFSLNDGTQLRLIVTSPNNNSLGWRLFIHNFWYILLLDILISGAACYYLARYITRDIQTLKKATQQIATGDWDVRIAEEFCNRPGELAELGRAFDNMAIKLQKSMLEQKRLIKDVSHELRSPLARLQVALAIAQQRANSEITGELDRIKEAADYLNDVISDILSLPVTEQGGWELDDVVELSSLVTTIVEECRDEAAQKSVTLSLSNNLPEVLIQTRGNTLAGVFDNIIRNAIRYTDDHSPVSIRIDRPETGQARISVSDCGPGVSPDHLDDIFEPFFRTDEARDRKSGGYGLGLAIAKRTVLHHGGTINARNNPVRGLSIVVTLPEIEEI
ncbi:HAMP domain-containing protein [Aestuariicella hydrocarbonica]|uniref:histidine kinase n=1 Tax=Pseudomaricurvus hydrocarbonicus TaxID=1470433 RepID=A0A9E5MH57_9GAMM|nr:ATP-binding protein [Aestuariicella hydrocarbonica]NHO65541.1 HAMP domain-containing protein [Aestuariicella hydrocarbonica]